MKFIRLLHNRYKGSKEIRLAENYVSLSALQVVNYLLPLVTLPYLVRVLGVEVYGLVMFAHAFIQYFVVLTDYGFNLSATREIAVNRDDPDKVAAIFNGVMIIKSLLLLAGLLLLVALLVIVPKFQKDYLIFLITYGIVAGQVLFPVWFFQGMEKMKYITMLNITAKVIFTVTLFIFVRNRDDYLLVPLLNSAGFIVAGCLSIWIVFRRFKVKPILPRMPQLIGQLRQSGQFFLSRVSVSLYTSSNTFILGLLVGNTAAGYYAAAEQLYKGMQGVFVPLANALYPFVSKERNIALFRKIYVGAMSAASVIAAIAFAFSGPITSLIFGAGFEPAADLLRLFALLILINVASVLIGYPFLAALDHSRYANFSVVAGSICHVLLLLIAIPFINIYWVAIITIITESIVLAIRAYGVRKYHLWRVACKPSF
ncbi:MAG: oligosaccharide flippase family protein [Candidatus Zixiibacteriota bacterium]|nr:MAG: oligosaccharide flippase family protein [candidate division Zixibacteria bacterium]